MGIGESFGEAFGKAQEAASMILPSNGTVFVSVKDEDKPYIMDIVKSLQDSNFHVLATGGTAGYLQARGIDCSAVNKVTEGRPHVVDMIKNNGIDLIINTTQGKQSISDSSSIRASALMHRVAYTTTVAGANAIVLAMSEGASIAVRRLQELHEGLLQ